MARPVGVPGRLDAERSHDEGVTADGRAGDGPGPATGTVTDPEFVRNLLDTPAQVRALVTVAARITFVKK